MKKWVVFLALGLVALAFIGAIVIYTKDKIPEDFGIYYESLSCGVQIFNSVNSLYSKTICDNAKGTSSLLTYTLNLTLDDKEVIYNSVVENDFFSLSDDVISNGSGPVSRGCIPSSTLIIRVNSSGKFKKVRADCVSGGNSGIGAISQAIREVISEKEQEMNIPRDDCICF